MVVVYLDGLESCWEYDELGRLVSEISCSGEIVCYCYDDVYSELSATIMDVMGSIW